MMKYFIFIIIGLTIDAFQVLLALGLAGIGLATSATVAWIPFIGAGAAATVNLFGIILGVAIDFTISATFGSGLIFLLIFFGLLKPMQFFSARRLPFIVAKFMPFIDMLPLYTALVVSCILQDMKKSPTKMAAGAAALSFASSGAGRLNALAQKTNARSPAIARAMHQQSLSSYPMQASRNQQEEVPVAKTLGARSILNDIRAPKTGRTGAAAPTSNMRSEPMYNDSYAPAAV